MTTVTAPELPHAARNATERQPRGLALLFFTEMWERFSYYGMRALLVLFLIDTSTGGFGWTQEQASRLYGWYTGLVYLTPIIGGYLADRYLGTSRSLIIGGIIIALGHFTLAVHSPTAFYAGLALIVIGTGFFKSNVSTMVGQLYRENDPRRDGGFTIFYMGINLGAFFGPLVCGWLAAHPKYGWGWGFGAAGVGMVLGLICFSVLRRKILGDVGMQPAGLTRTNTGGAAKDAPLTKEERDRVIALAIVAFFVAFFWLAFEQAGSSLNVFGQQKTDRAVTGWFAWAVPNGQIPAAWFQAINGLFIVVFAPVVAWVWKRLGTRQPSTPMKMVVGLTAVALGFVAILPGALLADRGGLASPWFLVSLYLFHTFGELCLSPVGLSFTTKVAPVKFLSMMMGVWFLSNFAANLAGGYVAGTVEKISRGEVFHVLGGQSDFFLLFIVSSFAAAFLLLLLVPLLKKLTHGRG